MSASKRTEHGFKQMDSVKENIQREFDTKLRFGRKGQFRILNEDLAFFTIITFEVLHFGYDHF